MSSLTFYYFILYLTQNNIYIRDNLGTAIPFSWLFHHIKHYPTVDMSLWVGLCMPRHIPIQKYSIELAQTRINMSSHQHDPHQTQSIFDPYCNFTIYFYFYQ